MSRLWKFQGDGRQLGTRGSWAGVVGTLGLLALCLSIYIPAVLTYLSGDYVQSLYETASPSSQTFYTALHFKMALTLRNKATGIPLNHSKLLESSLAFVTYKNHSTIYQQPLVPCQSAYFKKDVNGLVLDDCLMIPDFIEYDTGFDKGNFAQIYFTIQAPMGSSPFSSSTTLLNQAQYLYAQLLKDYYCQFYFTSQVIDTDSTIKLQVHRAYSTQLSFGSQTIGANFNILSGIRVTLMDDSIMPWMNLKNVTTMNWNGDFEGKAALNFNQVGMNGFKDSFKVVDKVQYAVRFYKKIDLLLAIIGGGCFLFYIIFKFIFGYYDRCMAIIDLANSILLMKTVEEYPQKVDDLVQPKISMFYPIRRLVPFCSIESIQKLMKEAEQMNDICLQLKRQKVTLRNLQTLNILEKFTQKQLRFPQLERLQQNQGSNQDGSQSTQKKSKDKNNQSFQFKILQNSNAHLDDSVNSQSVENNGNKVEVLEVPAAAESDAIIINVDQSAQNVAIIVPPGQAVQIVNQDEDNYEEENTAELLEIKEKLGLTLPQVRLLLKMNKMQKYFANAYPYRILKRQFAKKKYLKQLEKIKSQLNQQCHQQRQKQIIPIPDADFQGLQGQQPIRQRPQTIPVINIQEQEHDKERKKQQAQRKMALLKKQSQINEILRNLDSKNETFQQTQKYNKYENQFVKKVTWKSLIAEALSTFLKKFDLFTSEVKMWNRGIEKSCCWIIPNLIIIVMACLTFALAIQSMDKITFTSYEQFLELEKLNFVRETDADFNAIICLPDPTYYVGIGRSAKFSFVINNNGQKQIIDAIRMISSDPTLDLANNLRFTEQTFKQTNCFRLPYGLSVEMNQNSHFGLQFQPQCSNTPAYCAANIIQTNNNFVTAFNLNPLLLILPASNFDPFTKKLTTDVFTFTYLNAGQIKFHPNITLQQTVFVGQVRLFDDSGNTFMQNKAPMVQNNINLGYDTRRTVIKAQTTPSPSYTLLVRLNQAATDYVIRQYKINWILGMIGGAIVFWFMIVKLLTNPFQNFNIRSRLAKVIYGENSFDHSWFKKILAMTNIPRFLIPTCCDLRFDVDRMRAVDSKIRKSINHINLLKYTTNCFKLASRFFTNEETDDFAQIYFRQKIFEDDKVEKNSRFSALGGDDTFQQEENFDDMESELTEHNDKKKMLKNNKVDNTANMEKELQLNPNEIMNDQIKQTPGQQKQKQKIQQKDLDVQQQQDNIIDEQGQQTIRDKLDLFAQTRQFSLQGKRQYSSVTGGVCSIIMIGIILIVAWFMLGKYLDNNDLTVSYDVKIDDGPNSEGLELTTGKNFRIAVAFLSPTTLQPFDSASFMTDVGISILVESYSRSNGIITPTISKINLQLCSSSYLTQWVSPLVEKSYLSSMQHLYCVPNGHKLRIQGTAQSSLRQNFKLSIYNKQGGAQGLAKIGDLLNTTYIRVYVSSPTQNSFDSTPKYDINEILFSNFGGRSPVVPFQSNITFSKVKINFTDEREWQSNKKQVQTYRIQPYNTDMIGYEYLGINPNLNIWFNVSFAYTHKVHLYTHSRPKFAEVFGIFGGICAFFFIVLGCFVSSFTSYKMQYQIGKDLYLFGKRLIIKNNKNIKTKLRKHKKDKKLLQQLNNMNEGHLLWAYLLTPFAYITNEYNFNQNLRRVTLIQDRVERDLDLQHFYTELYRSRESLRKKLRKVFSQQDTQHLTQYYFKQVANHSPENFTVTSMKNYAKRHNISCYQQRLVSIAGGKRVNVREVLSDLLLEELFDKVIESNMRIDVGQVGDVSEGSIGTSSAESSLGESTVPETEYQ